MADDNNKNKKISGAFSNRNIENTTSGLQICDITTSAFDMTAMLSAAQNYTKLNAAINKLIGMEVRWFRAIPQQRSQDVIFQEYTLSCVAETPLCLKVILPDGGFPDSKYNFDLMGLEYEVPLEIHIDKGYWESIAGTGTAPQKKDIIYFAVPNKLYEVVSSYLLRGFMEQETTWKLNLRKYQPQASRKEGDGLTKTIDDYTISAEEIFGDKLDSDIKKITNNKQMSPFNSTTQDVYKTLDSSLVVIPSELNIYGAVVAQAFYDLSYCSSVNAIIYNASDNITTTTDRCITAWTSIDHGVESVYDVSALTYNALLPLSANYELTLKSTHKGFDVGDNLNIYRSAALNLYAELIRDVSGDNTFHLKINETVLTHLNTISSAWNTLGNYKMRIRKPVSILDGMAADSSTHKLRVDILANQYIKIVYSNQEHISIMPEQLNEKEWYGVVINIGNSWGQYNTHIYKQHPSDATEKLQSVFYETMNLTPESMEIGQYQINESPSYLTNIRLYTLTMEEEKQRNELLSYFVRDGDQLKIGDNCDIPFKGPYLGKQH